MRAVINQDAANCWRLRCSPRQAEMLGLAATSMTDKVIANRLELSVSTIRSYWQRFYRDNGVHSRTAAVVIWLTVGSPLKSDH